MDLISTLIYKVGRDHVGDASPTHPFEEGKCEKTLNSLLNASNDSGELSTLY